MVQWKVYMLGCWDLSELTVSKQVYVWETDTSQPSVPSSRTILKVMFELLIDIKWELFK